jgi:hypothetical protein
MIESILLVGGPLDGQKRGCDGGDVLFLPSIGRGLRRLVYRRAHAESKFFHFLSDQGA